MDEPTTPYDIQSERAVLGSCLLERDAIIVVRDLLGGEDFYLEKHAQIFYAMVNLLDRRVPPDFVTVCGELREMNMYDMVGGAGFLSELLTETITAVHVESYAQRVLQCSAQRRIIQLGAQIQASGYNGGDLESIYAEMQAMMEVTRQASQPKANWQEAVINARMLYRHKFEQLPFTVQDILPPGTTLLTGKPKTRKSWLALNISWAVAAGGKALGHYQALQGDVLYIDLEMGAARLNKRLHVVSPNAEPPKGFAFATKWPPVGEGFERWLRDYLKSHPFTRLVVVDTMVGIRPQRKRYEDPYEADKRFSQALSNLCQEYRISMLLIHHSRKADGSDVTDDASGTTGLTGGVDNTAILRLSRTEKCAGELFLRGRDIEIDGDLNLKWDAMLAQWNLASEGAEVLTPERRAVLQALRDNPGLKPRELALVLGREEGGTKRLLSDMKKAGLVVAAQGCYFDAEDEADGNERAA